MIRGLSSLVCCYKLPTVRKIWKLEKENKPLLQHKWREARKCGYINYVLNANAGEEHNKEDMKDSLQNLIAREKQIISNI